MAAGVAAVPRFTKGRAAQSGISVSRYRAENQDKIALPARFGARRMRVVSPREKQVCCPTESFSCFPDSRKKFSQPLPGRESLTIIKLSARFTARWHAPGNPRRGFPTAKQSAGLFCLPSCAFARKRISLRARSDQRRCLWILPPLKRRAKFYVRADRLRLVFPFPPDRGFYKS